MQRGNSPAVGGSRGAVGSAGGGSGHAGSGPLGSQRWVLAVWQAHGICRACVFCCLAQACALLQQPLHSCPAYDVAPLPCVLHSAPPPLGSGCMVNHARRRLTPPLLCRTSHLNLQAAPRRRSWRVGVRPGHFLSGHGPRPATQVAAHLPAHSAPGQGCSQAQAQHQLASAQAAASGGGRTGAGGGCCRAARSCARWVVLQKACTQLYGCVYGVHALLGATPLWAQQ